MKKMIALLLTVLLVFSAALPAFADGDETYLDDEESYIKTEGGFIYILSDDGKALEGVLYIGEDEICRVPKTLGGVAVTPDNLNGEVFVESAYISKFVVDDDNAYFSVVDDMLFTKDGKTLIYCPDERCNGVCVLPEGTEKLGRLCIYDELSLCVVVPASVQEIDKEFSYWGSAALAGEAGIYAEQFAADHDRKFVTLGEGHEHVYFRTFTKFAETCDDISTVEVVCPCGESIYRTDLEPVGHDWRLEYDYDYDSDDLVYEVVCYGCGKTYQEVYGKAPSAEFLMEAFGLDINELSPEYEYHCTCACHYADTEFIYEINGVELGVGAVLAQLVFARFRYDVYLIRLFFWRMLGINRYCNCGVRHY